MKKAAGLLLFLAMAVPALAQQNTKSKHMTITIMDAQATFTIGKSNNVFITRDDTAQVAKYVKLKNKMADRESQLFDLVEPYYSDGWKLVSTSAEGVPDTTLPTEVFRYYFVKQE
jgi:hypothetical protein